MKADKMQIVICGNYGSGNLGDEAILDGLIRLCDTCWPGAKLTVLSSRPRLTAREHSVKSVQMFPAGLKSFLQFWLGGKFWKTLRAVSSADLVILGGGGLFTDEKWRAVWIWTVQACWFRLLRRPYICLAQSVGPLRTRSGRWLASRVFRKAKFCSVRDQQSAELLRELSEMDAIVLSDAAFALGYEAPRARNVQDYAVLSLRDWGSRMPSHAVAEAVDWLWSEKRLHTIFIPFQEQGDDDRKVFAQIKSLVKEKSVLEMKEVEDYAQALEMIGRGRLVLGMRLHSLIFAALCCRPFVGISYSSKVRAMARELGMEDYCAEFNGLNADEIIGRLKKFFAQEKELIAELEQKKLQLTYRFFEHEKALRKLLP
jgi:polysaccharide pyruvyl transferase CsaB